MASQTIQRWKGYIGRLSPERQAAAAVALLGTLLYLPYVGAVGLWDPWETHYGEVARMMIQRRDYVHPYWENAWFFSKPPLTMWMDVLGMQVVGTNRTQGPLALYTEWGMRLPFVVLSVAALTLMTFALCRIAGRRTALGFGAALATMPMYWLLTRQVVTDTPFVCTQMCAMACALMGQLDTKTRHRTAWWYAFYVFLGLSTLAKGILGFGVPAVVLVLYFGFCLMPWDGESLRAHGRWLASRRYRREVKSGQAAMPSLWEQMGRMKLLSGIGIFLLVCGPWYAKLFSFDGVDDEGQKFWYRFLIHDHLNRLTAGVHTTTPGGSFVYFIEQGGYAIFPWVALLPGMWAVVSRARFRSGQTRDQLTVIGVFWAVLTFGLVAFSATKFHHYVFPVLPALALLMGLFIDRLWEDGLENHLLNLLVGLVLFALVGKDLAEHPKNFTDLFVYNYDRPYPTELVERPISFWGGKTLWMGDVVGLLLLCVGAYQASELLKAKQEKRSMGAGIVGLVFVALGAGLLLALSVLPRSTGVEWMGAWMQPVNVKFLMGLAFTLGGLWCLTALALRSRNQLFGAFGALAFCFALWFNWSHWVNLSHHWTQRDQFWRYYRLRNPDEPIAAYLMNWRGETFYSKNTVKQIKENGMMARYAALPGRKWSLVEHNRLPLLRSAVGPGKVVTPIDPGLNNKFVLVKIE